ncbi:dCTP deaminase [Caldisericum sp. AR60]|uniref:dCTP deaminase n=1 Tax=Caldisericum exile TaxID=693075 RepID=A0A2J6X515_9BACT|nr:MAG: dCTP deaminase [Caldisericum exile]
MGLKSDKWIKEKAIKEKMIEPFVDHLESHGVISYGLSSYGYDMRIANEFKVFTGAIGKETAIVDPKKFDKDLLQDYVGDFVIIPPNSYVLGKSVEYFRIPKNVHCIVLGKSTYARSGIIVNITPLESGWNGFVTIEISNATPLPVKVYANEGIAQVLFFEGDEACEVSYEDRHGKYQNQEGIILPKVDKNG